MTQATILYVDDEAMALKYFDRLISPNFTVLTALSVAEGIEILKAQGQNINVLISDQRMPGANGNELLRFARHNYPHIVRLLTTAYSELGEAIVAINAGEIYRYITKPWDVDMLRTEVRLAVEVATLRTERDELLSAKIQVQEAQLLANRVNNLALVCGYTDAANEANPANTALQQYIRLIKNLGGVSLTIDWRSLHYTDWMQSEAARHSRIQMHIADWLAQWGSANDALSIETLRRALDGRDCTASDLTTLLSDANRTPSAKSVACLAWFIAVHMDGQQAIEASINSAPSSLALRLVPKPLQATDNAPTTLSHDWLADAMEQLNPQP
jgi:two-component system, probable response regulator PhcQ